LIELNKRIPDLEMLPTLPAGCSRWARASVPEFKSNAAMWTADRNRSLTPTFIREAQPKVLGREERQGETTCSRQGKTNDDLLKSGKIWRNCKNVGAEVKTTSSGTWRNNPGFRSIAKSIRTCSAAGQTRKAATIAGKLSHSM
jgi:hypothetical protein